MTLTSILGTTVFASTEKVCFGSKQNDDTKGVVLKISVDSKNIHIKTAKTGNGQMFNEEYYKDHSYPAYNSSVKSRDGKIYLEYKGENTDYQDVIMVDKELLKKATSGLLQFRARGEGFFNSVFVCRDPQY
jgi:hypothetical protein